jgi:prepilin signal peptidase PulO-like enzyme (type II secretory pathway)
MLPKVHLTAGIIFIFLIYLFFPDTNKLGLLIILASSVLIDADHMFYYFFKTKDISLSNALKWYKNHRDKLLTFSMSERKKRYTGFYIFHGIEWIPIIFFLGILVSPIFIYLLIGVSFHLLLDIPSEFLVKRTLHKSSLIYNYSQFKKLERR